MQKGVFMRISVLLVFLVFFIGLLTVVLNEPHITQTVPKNTKVNFQNEELHPLSILAMRNKSYPGSKLIIEEEIAPGTNYKQYIASYKSEGLKIYGLLTVPTTPQPPAGYPVIIFNHGYIPPAEYQTTERYVAYQDGFAKNGYVTFKSDYRGHGNSEGEPLGAYFSPAYTIDVLNALGSIKKLPYVNKNKIGMWGHSLGGNITQRAIVIDPDIKAAVIWGGVVGSYEDIFRDWWSKRRNNFTPSSREMNANRPTRQMFITAYGEPKEGDPFWNAISPTTYMKFLNTPIQLHHGQADETVPDILSKDYYKKLIKAGKKVEAYYYPGDDHNISQSFDLAMQRSVDFFNMYLK